MNFIWFKDLGHLAKTGNFSQAAVLSNISQPALSRRIQALEAWMSVPLIDRSKHPVRLTAAGVQMLETGLQVLARLEVERKQILDAQMLPDKYVVTFGAQHSIAWRFYPAWLQAFEEAFGPILSRLRADDLSGCIRDLKNGHVDFVVAYRAAQPAIDNPIVQSEGEKLMESLLIGQDCLIPVCKAQPSNGKPMFDFDSDASTVVPFLHFGDKAPITHFLQPLLDAKDLHPRLQTVYENAMVGALRIRARDGAGVAWLPRSVVAPDLESGLLTRTGAPDWEVTLDIRLYRKRGSSNQLTRSIWSFLAVRKGIALLD